VASCLAMKMLGQFRMLRQPSSGKKKKRRVNDRRDHRRLRERYQSSSAHRAYIDATMRTRDRRSESNVSPLRRVEGRVGSWLVSVSRMRATTAFHPVTTTTIATPSRGQHSREVNAVGRHFAIRSDAIQMRVPCESDRTQSRELPAEPHTPRRPPRRARGGYRHPDERNDLVTTRDWNSSDGREGPSPPLRPHLKVYRDERERIVAPTFSHLLCLFVCT